VLRITIFPHGELFDASSGTFKKAGDGYVMDLEHSLISVSKWEEKWEVPFLADTEKTDEQVMDYVKCMVVGPEPPPEIWARLTADHVKAIQDHISAKKTATWFSKKKPSGPAREIITSELIYYWMVTHNIPPEYQNWHLSRLLTLIEVCNVKNAPAEKKDPKTAAAERRALNDARRKQHNTTG
jgi:hypothetical protein